MERHQGPSRSGLLLLPVSVRRDILIVLGLKFTALAVIYAVFFSSPTPSNIELAHWLDHVAPLPQPSPATAFDRARIVP